MNNIKPTANNIIKLDFFFFFGLTMNGVKDLKFESRFFCRRQTKRKKKKVKP